MTLISFPLQQTSSILSIAKHRLFIPNSHLKLSAITHVLLTAMKSCKPSGVTPDWSAVSMCCLRSTSVRTLRFNWMRGYQVLIQILDLISIRFDLLVQHFELNGVEEMKLLLVSPEHHSLGPSWRHVHHWYRDGRKTKVIL